MWLHFQLHPLLRLNFTFLIIDTWDTILEVWDSNSALFHFHGWYSISSFYPKFQNLSLRNKQILTTEYVFYIFSSTDIVLGSFIVMDANLVHVIPVPKDVFSKPAYVYKIQTRYIIFYFLQVRKIDQIFIQILGFHTCGYIIYDGVGIL